MLRRSAACSFAPAYQIRLGALGVRAPSIHRTLHLHSRVLDALSCHLLPGTTDPFDTLDQLQQFNGIMSATAQNVQLINPDIFLNNHHPVFHTVLVGSFVNLGAALGSQSVGLFLFVLLQTGLLAAGFAGMVSLQREFRTPLWARIAMLAIVCFVPLFPSWAVCVAKDTLFTAFILLYLVVLVRFMLNPNLLHKPFWIMTFILTSILVCLTRNNGVFVVLFTAVALFIAYRKKPLRTLGRYRARWWCASLCIRACCCRCWAFRRAVCAKRCPFLRSKLPM